MNFEFFARQLARNTDRIESLVEGVTSEEAVWRPDSESWSIVEVINHLYDEEREDFRVRLNIILHSPEKPLPDIDPQGWVVVRKYNERDLKRSLKAFLEERNSSLQWLNSLEEPNWSASYEMPWGAIRAGDMFAAWVTHDHLHMRQLVEIHRAYTELMAEPYSLRYAGDWGE